MNEFENQCEMTEDIKLQLFTCDKCPVRYKYKRNLTHHIRTKHTMSLKIGNVFSLNEHSEGLDEHYDQCNGTLPKQCEVDSYVNKQSSEVHYSIGGAYQCPNCLMFFSSEYLLRRHVKYNHGRPQSHKCDQCPKTFACASHLTVHKRKHSETYHPCPYCPRSFPTKNMLEMHIEFHTIARPFKCCECSKHFIKNEHLEEHINVIHLKSKLKIECCSETVQIKLEKPDVPDQDSQDHNALFKCNQCEMTFKTLYYLTNHKKLHWKTIYVCPYCPKSYKLRGALNAHVRIHYVCAFCSEKFYKESNLRDHLKICEKGSAIDSNIEFYSIPDTTVVSNISNIPVTICNGDTAYVGISEIDPEPSSQRYKVSISQTFHCNYCSKLFTSHFELEKHGQLDHNTDNSLVINGVNKSISILGQSSKVYMSSSIKTYSKSHPFQCTQCPKSYKYRHGLNEHLRLHNGDLICPTCSKIFRRKDLLNKHAQKCTLTKIE